MTLGRLPVMFATSTALFAFALTFTVVCVALPLAGRGRGSSEWIVHGVALGMSEREVRAYFVDGPSGSWSVASGCSGPGLQWVRKGRRTPVRYARFEFRDGALVSMRVRSDHEPYGLPAEATATAVRKQHEDAAGSEIAIIDRTCVEHRAEAEEIAWMANARRSGSR
jgi:hypothetical protein